MAVPPIIEPKAEMVWPLQSRIKSACRHKPVKYRCSMSLYVVRIWESEHCNVLAFFRRTGAHEDGGTTLATGASQRALSQATGRGASHTESPGAHRRGRHVQGRDRQSACASRVAPGNRRRRPERMFG